MNPILLLTSFAAAGYATRTNLHHSIPVDMIDGRYLKEYYSVHINNTELADCLELPSDVSCSEYDDIVGNVYLTCVNDTDQTVYRATDKALDCFEQQDVEDFVIIDNVGVDTTGHSFNTNIEDGDISWEGSIMSLIGSSSELMNSTLMPNMVHLEYRTA